MALGSSYNTQGFQIGVITTTKAVGIADTYIQLRGQWRRNTIAAAGVQPEDHQLKNPHHKKDWNPLIKTCIGGSVPRTFIGIMCI